MDYNSWVYRHLVVPFSIILSGIKWETLYYLFKGRRQALTLDDMYKVNDQLTRGRYILLSRRNSHLTTYFISLGNFLLTGKWAHYTHAFVNITKSNKRAIWEAQFLEAIGSGVGYSAFRDVINVDSICILNPKGVSEQEWGNALARVVEKYHNRPYDDLFKLKDYTALSCVELVLAVILELPDDLKENFQTFFDMIDERKNLTPQMYYECPDCFELVLEIRR